jgi:hypothetical protein
VLAAAPDLGQGVGQGARRAGLVVTTTARGQASGHEKRQRDPEPEAQH